MDTSSSGDKVNIIEISKMTGVSPTTVSRVINHRELVKEETARLVEEAIASSGYVTKSTKPVQKKSNKNILIMNAPSKEQFYLEISKGVEMAAKTSGYYLLNSWFSITRESLNCFLDMIVKTNAAGVIFLNQLPKDILEAIDAVVPVVQCCEFNPSVDLPYVSIDDFSAAQKATNHLINEGRKKILFVSGSQEYKYVLERRRGYLSAMQQANLPVTRSSEITLPENSFSLACTAIMQVLRSEEIKPDAIFTSSDILAMAAVRAVKYCALLIPRDIMIVGFDDIKYASMTSPPLTTVRQPSQQLGYSACSLLLQRITTPGFTPKSMILDTELILRESTTGSIFST